jgi:hypothetical protein
MRARKLLRGLELHRDVEPIEDATGGLRAALGRFLELTGAIGEDRDAGVRVDTARAKEAVEAGRRRAHLVVHVGVHPGRAALEARATGDDVDVPGLPARGIAVPEPGRIDGESAQGVGRLTARRQWGSVCFRCQK